MPWADLSDSRCWYELLGGGDPLILIPGLGATSRIWDPVATDLAQFFSVILIDNRGLGRSVARRRASALCDLTSDVVELLDHLQIDRAHVMGVSLGGIIAQRLAVDHPSRVDRLVLGSCAETFSPYLRQMSMLLAHTLRRFPREMFLRTIELLGNAPEHLDANAELIERRIQSNVRTRTSARAIAHQLRCLARSELEREQFRIGAPTLVVAGEYDPIIPNCYSRRMSERIPGSEFYLVRGAGHNPLFDQPELVLPKVIEFLRGRERSSRVATGNVETCVAFQGGSFAR